MAVLHAIPIGGLEPDKDANARFALRRCLLKTNDLLLSEQMATQIAHDRKNRSHLSPIDIVVPVLVVQGNFVSSMFTVPWLVKSFRDLMRKKFISPKVVWTSLLVLHVEDVESIQTYIKKGNFSVGECLLYAGKCGDPGSGQGLFEFTDLFRRFLTEKSIQPVKAGANKRFEEILDRVTLRLFNRKFEPLSS